MIPEAEIDKVVRRAAAYYQRHWVRAQRYPLDEIVNEGWRIALEALPYQQAAGAPLDPYIFGAVLKGLRRALAMQDFPHDDPALLEHVPDRRPLADAVLISHEKLRAAVGRLSDLDRSIVSPLLGIDSPVRPAPEVARACRVMVGRVYQARAEFRRRIQEAA